MAMVLVAILFLIEQRILIKKQYLLSSCFYFVSILSFFLLVRAFYSREIIRQLKVRHESDAQPLSRRAGSGCNPNNLTPLANVIK
jgi:hypothetical protein